jgi:hypothetical protein
VGAVPAGKVPDMTIASALQDVRSDEDAALVLLGLRGDF